MTEPLAVWNGEFLPTSQVSVPIYDGGFVQGTTVAEQIRTFNGELYALESHLQRLQQSLDCVQVQLPYSMAELKTWMIQLAADNHQRLEPGDDLALCLFVTPGPYLSFAAAPGVVPADRRGPSVVMHTYPLPFQNWARQYQIGEQLEFVEIREVPAACWPAALKCRSRMHYYLADLEARSKNPKARALLLDIHGYVAEASTASVFLFREGEGFVAPREEDVLPSISLRTLREFAESRQIPWVHRRIEPQEVFDSQEVLLCSTSPCVLPVTQIDRKPIGSGTPGPRWQEMMQCWNERVGLDVVAQAQQFSTRHEASL
jgi:branched-chain amino acid aminotransferase